MKSIKNSWYLAICIFILQTWSGCQIKRTTDKKDQSFENKEMLEASLTFSKNQWKEINQSDNHFTAAVKAYKEHNNPEVIRQIRMGIHAIINEGEDLEGEPKTRLLKDMRYMKDVIFEIENNRLNDMMALQDALATAELAVAHEYSNDMNVYSIKVPLPDSYYPHYKAALKAIMGAQKRMRGEALKEVRVLLSESNQVLDQIDEGKNLSEQQIRDQKAKMDAFLAKYYHPEQTA
ncbi:MAG: hypothetical protein KDC53_14410 [Saprospiraceae bacterium]|nr:hypothetical protein [Saprospiraceae bacterium]